MSTTICNLTIPCSVPTLAIETIISNLQVRRIIQDVVYLHERGMWEKQHVTDGYRRSFIHEVTINGWPCIVVGVSYCSVSFGGFNTFIESIEPEVLAA